MNTPFPQSMADCLQRIAPRLVAVRRDLHRHPELAGLEFRTAALAVRRVLELGYTVVMGQDAQQIAAMPDRPDAATLAAAQERAEKEGADAELLSCMSGGCGFWADMDCGPGPFVAVRVDMDANQLEESAETEGIAAHRPARDGFASLHPGVMHACGHDGHVAIGLGLAEVLAAGREHLRGHIRLLFQPAEEGAKGAMTMTAAGAVQNVDVLFGIHLGIQARELGTVICGSTDFLATTKLRVTFTGKAAHAGASPQEGRNAILAACTATLHLHAISRTSQGDTRVTVGRIEGGDTANVIPAWATLLLETRGITDEANAYMQAEARRMIEAAADMWGCTVEITPLGGASGGSSDAVAALLLADAARDMPWFTTIIEQQAFGASEDFSTLLREVQRQGGVGSYVQMGTTLTAGHHAALFDFDESALAPAVELLARAVLRCTQSHKE